VPFLIFLEVKMLLSLTPTETIFLYETLLKTKVVEADSRDAQQKLLLELRSMILQNMQTVQDQTNKTKFESWILQEEKRISDLNKNNSQIKIQSEEVNKKGQKNARIIRKTA
jgi:hypothetical protein